MTVYTENSPTLLNAAYALKNMVTDAERAGMKALAEFLYQEYEHITREFTYV